MSQYTTENKNRINFLKSEDYSLQYKKKPNIMYTVIEESD